MDKPPESPPGDHPVATAIGKTLGTIARKVGLVNAAPAPAPKKRTPRKAAKKAATKSASSVKKTATAKRAPKKAVAKKTR